jgi:hypothetical protein
LIPLESPYNVTNELSALNNMSSAPQMSNPLSNFESILDAALSEYKLKTGKELLDHTLATEVQGCDTVDAVLAILQDQAKAFQQFKDGDQKLIERIGPLTQVLFAFSETLGVGDIGLVLLIRGDSKYMLTLLHRHSLPQKE